MLPAEMLLAHPGVAAAATFHWSGLDPSSTHWAQLLNWSLLLPPTYDGQADIVFGDAPGSHSPTIDTNWSVRGITFTSPIAYEIPSAGGAILTVGRGGITHLASGFALDHVIQSPLALGAAQSWVKLAASLAGILIVTSPAPLTPTPRDSVVLMTHGSRTGTFGAVGLPLLTTGATWELEYGVTELVDAERPAGVHELDWGGEDAEGRRLPGGLYFVRLLLDGRPAGAALRVARIQ